jgi:hypothetical protein
LAAIDVRLDTTINKQEDDPEDEGEGVNINLDLDKTEKNIQYEFR